MPFDNLAQKHFTPSEQEAVNAHLTKIMEIITPKASNLTPEERSSFGSVGETNKLIINKVKDYYTASPELASIDVDWAEFMADYNDRVFLQQLRLALESTVQIVDNTRIAHDYDNYYASLNDYDYSTFKLRTNPSFEVKVRELKQFFNRTGTGGGDSQNNQK